MKGFTLVELLIVIALLGAIAIAVIAAINPIEQANRARDTRFKTDSSNLVSAIERYFTSKNEFPWVTSAFVTSNDVAFGFLSSNNVNIGVCGATCTQDGNLITSLELKSEYKDRDFVKAGTGTDNSKKIFVGKATGGSQSIYACFIPLSKSTRDKEVADGRVYTLNFTNGTRTATTSCNAATADWTALGCYICVP